VPSATPSAADLLAWYDRHRRILPWRAGPGEARDTYRIWLSEVMLQQTTVAAVGPRYARFLARFPTVQALAAADWAEVAEEWAGLGYYARARNLHACARAVAAAGRFPCNIEGLAALPGIGPYTASAVGAIAFDAPVVPVDGNVERVVARLHAIEDPLPGSKPRLTALAAGFMADAAARARPGDFAQALFDLGATICTPRGPACALCPWQPGCAAHRAGIAGSLPRKSPRPARPLRHGAHFLLRDHAGSIFLRRRPASGLLGGMLEVPGTPWREARWNVPEALPHAPVAAPWRLLPGLARHGFTHFEIEMVLFAATLPAGAAVPAGEWQDAQAARAAVPSVMRRLLDLAAAAP
jgi:A/G-specific adenine glycosylase